jgi:5-methyltetrahydropteroyltriglutamate--homocysteine methyltransferase
MVMATNLFPAQEVGSLRKPQWALGILRDRRIAAEAKEQTRDDLAYLNVRLLEDAGLDLIYDGEARRVEMYEYAIRRIPGFVFSGRVKVWDDKYFRKARCVKRIRYPGPYHLDEFRFVQRYARKEPKVPVTGPYTLADWSFNEHYRSREDFVLELAREIIRPLLRDLAAAGAQRIQLDEPAATAHPAEMKLFVEAFNEAVAGVPANVSLHICYPGDDYRSLFPHALELKTTQFVLEFANRDGMQLGASDQRRTGYDALRLFREYRDHREVGLGVVDVHRDVLESPELIRDRILHAVQALDDPRRVWVNPDCGLRTRSRPVAFEKLRRMVEGARLARAALA